jgi:hypothetical protein
VLAALRTDLSPAGQNRLNGQRTVNFRLLELPVERAFPCLRRLPSMTQQRVNPALVQPSGTVRGLASRVLSLTGTSSMLQDNAYADGGASRHVHSLGKAMAMSDLGSRVETVNLDRRFRMRKASEELLVIESRRAVRIGKLDPAGRSEDEEISEI